MTAGQLRLGAILLFAAAAVLSGLGNTTGHRVLTAIAFGCFALGVACLMRWRQALRARKVLDSEDKTR